MEAPKCRLCGERHWPRDGCKISQEVKQTIVRQVVNKAPVVVNRSADRHKPRKEYMREYMRKRREQSKRMG